MNEFLQIMIWPFLACLVLTGIHAYLGLHVIERQVIFVDLALAQIAVLGASIALVFGHGLDSAASYWLSLSFTVIGAGLFSLTRFRRQRIPHEAIIGIVYVVCAALLLLVLNFSGEGTEQIRQSLVGNILLITPHELWKIFLIYSAVGFLHYAFRRPFLLISSDPAGAFRQGLNVRWWDFLFYATLGIVVTSSVKIAGVLLVFSFLVIPAVAAMLYAQSHRGRLIFGWMFGTVGSMAGIAVSYFFDWPTAASVVCVFAFLLLAAAGMRHFLDAPSGSG